MTTIAIDFATEIDFDTEITTACTNCGGAHHVQQCGELRAALGRFDADSTIAWLREELDEEREFADLLIYRIQRDDPELYEALLEDATPSARAWLRREAK